MPSLVGGKIERCLKIIKAATFYIATADAALQFIFWSNCAIKFENYEKASILITNIGRNNWSKKREKLTTGENFLTSPIWRDFFFVAFHFRVYFHIPMRYFHLNSFWWWKLIISSNEYKIFSYFLFIAKIVKSGKLSFFTRDFASNWSEVRRSHFINEVITIFLSGIEENSFNHGQVEQLS